MNAIQNATRNAILFLLVLGLTPIYSESVMEKASAKRVQLIKVLRTLRPMINNFPCEPFPECMPPEAGDKQGMQATERPKRFEDAKRVYQEGLIYYFEGNYVNAWSRFLDTEMRVEALLEGLSQFYIDRTDEMMRDAIEKKDENNPTDKSVVEITIDYGPGSKLVRDYTRDREAPHTERRYEPREVHYFYNRYRIEKNMEKGYEHLGLAKTARMRALTVDKNLAPGQKIDHHHRALRIDYYLDSIYLARRAKLNAEFIFGLKYPYDNYYLQNPFGKTETTRNKTGESVTTDGVTMNWSENSYIYPANLNPVFDKAIPDKYRRDAVDAREMRYADEVDTAIKLRYQQKKPPSFQGGQTTP